MSINLFTQTSRLRGYYSGFLFEGPDFDSLSGVYEMTAFVFYLISSTLLCKWRFLTTTNLHIHYCLRSIHRRYL